MKAPNRYILILAVILASCQKSTWNEFRSAEGGFSVLLPGIPVQQTLTVNTENGPIDTHVFLLNLLAIQEIAYTVSFADYPENLIKESSPTEILDNARDEAVAGIQGKLLLELIINLDGYEGREFRVESPDGEYTLVSRVFLIGKRIYQVGVEQPKQKVFWGHVSKFLDSFKLLKTKSH